MTVERYRLRDAESFHDHEADCITERIRLVCVTADEQTSAMLVLRTNPLNGQRWPRSLNTVEKGRR